MSSPTANSSSSNQAEKLSHSENVLELGKRLVDELDLEDSVDTLGRWMAHYIAEKIKLAEAADEKSRQEKMRDASDEILKLWSHRRDFDRAKRPLESFDPIFRTLQNLDPESVTSHYFNRIDDECECEQTRKYLSLAKECDEAVRHVISYCLTRAAETALDKEQDWVKLSAQITPSDDDLRAVAILLGDKGYGTDRKKELITKLNHLIDSAQATKESLSGAPSSQKRTKRAIPAKKKQ